MNQKCKKTFCDTKKHVYTICGNVLIFMHSLTNIEVFFVARIKEDTHSFSVRLPVSLTEEIDQLCFSNYITRTSWLIKAAKEKIERERKNNTENIIEKIARLEKEK